MWMPPSHAGVVWTTEIDGEGWRVSVEHLVLIKPKPGISAEQMDQLVEGARSLGEAGIPGVLALSAGINFSRRNAGYLCALRVLMRDRDALATYADHPAHRAYVEVLDALTADRIIADFEVPDAEMAERARRQRRGAPRRGRGWLARRSPAC
jgi:hypothetical protein